MDKALRSILHWWESAGVDVPPIAPTSRQPVSRRVVGRAAPDGPPNNPAPAASKISAPTGGASFDHIKTLDGLSEAIRNFDAGQLSDHARQAVISRGNPDADIMVIGEAPGRDEDIQGKPFVGRSGQLLDKVFASIGLNEESLYITNVVFWRPPGNRNPTPEELAQCLPLTQRHMELIDPKLIVLVGGVSFSALTGQTGIMKNRGQWTSLSVNGQDVPTLPIYHPAFLLRQPALKKDAWRDMLSLREAAVGISA